MAENLGPLGIVGGPTQAQVDEWKSKYGDIYVATFSPTEKYVYRSIKRLEYKQIISLQQTSENRAFVEEKIAQMCVVWPESDATKLATTKGGTISTLVELIMAASNFGITEEPVKL